MAKVLYGFKEAVCFNLKKGQKNPLQKDSFLRIKNPAILIENGIIEAIDAQKNVFKHRLSKNAEKIKISGIVFPAFVDSHTHSVFSKPRLEDFSLRTAGATYQEIKKSGGGIMSSVRALRDASKRDLEKKLLLHCNRFLENGTATAEVKSGYGLDEKNEIKMLETVKSVSKNTHLEVLPTFLGAHSLPPEFKKPKEYLEYLIVNVLPKIKKNNLAVFADIFCEDGYFSVEESIAYLKECVKFGLKPKIHAEQLKNFGGALAAIKARAVSADHMDYVSDSDLNGLKKAEVTVTFLPASNYFLGLSHFPDAGRFADKNIPIALASDFNPGTSPCQNMQFVISCAVTHMKMTIEQALFASTYNGALALGLSDKIGSIEKGKQADLAVFDIDDYREIAYYFGGNLNKATIKKGEFVYEKNSAL